MINSQFEMPNQRLSESKWNKEMYVKHANLMIQHLGNKTITERNEVIESLYRAYSCEKSSKENAADSTVTKQYGFSLGVKYIVYPLIEMIIDQLVGEYLSLPMRKKSYSINKAAINKRLDDLVRYQTEEIFREENKKLEEELGFIPETENPEIELPDNIEEHFEKNYKTLVEELSDDIIENFLENKKEKRKIKTLLQDFLISEQSSCYIGEKDGHPTIERAKFDECYVDLDPEEEIQTNVNIFAFFPFMTKNQILNKYDLTDSQKKEIDKSFALLNQSSLLEGPFGYGGSGVDYSNTQNCSQGVSYKGWYDHSSKNRLRVMKMIWKSRKQIRVKVHTNKHTGKDIYTILDKDASPRKRDTIKSIYVEIVRKVEMLGPEIVLNFGEDNERITFIDNNKKVVLPAVALRGRNTMYSSEIRSVAAKVVPLQKMASDILFEIRLSIKANAGRVLVYDTSQIPKQFLDSYGKKGAINRMLHHVKKDKILLFNSKENNSKQTFNQFTSLDLSSNKQSQELINALMTIEDLARKFVGLSKERSGEVDRYQTKAGTDRAVLGSNARTEIYFNPFDEYVQEILNKTLLKAKKIYKKGQVFGLIFGDLLTKFLTIFDDFFNVDIGVYLGSRFKDKRSKEIIDQAAVQALGNATDKELIFDLINVLDAEHASESKAILQKGLKAFEKLQSANQKAAQEANQQAQEHEQSIEEMKNTISREGFEKDIEVAKIYANNKTFNEGEKLNSQELQLAAKIESDALAQEKAMLNKE